MTSNGVVIRQQLHNMLQIQLPVFSKSFPRATLGWVKFSRLVLKTSSSFLQMKRNHLISYAFPAIFSPQWILLFLFGNPTSSWSNRSGLASLPTYNVHISTQIPCPVSRTVRLRVLPQNKELSTRCELYLYQNSKILKTSSNTEIIA